MSIDDYTECVSEEGGLCRCARSGRRGSGRPRRVMPPPAPSERRPRDSFGSTRRRDPKLVASLCVTLLVDLLLLVCVIASTDGVCGQIVAAHPDIRFGQVSKILGATWQALPPEEKEVTTSDKKRLCIPFLGLTVICMPVICACLCLG